MRPTLELSPLVDNAGIKLTGEVDLATARQLTAALADISTDSELGAIVAFAQSRNGGGPVVLLNPSRGIERLFEISSLEQHPKIQVRHTNGSK